MNVLAQQAMADAVNMTTDELANSLVQQDNLKIYLNKLKKILKNKLKL
jgi:hypothetical protein